MENVSLEQAKTRPPMPEPDLEDPPPEPGLEDPPPDPEVFVRRCRMNEPTWGRGGESGLLRDGEGMARIVELRASLGLADERWS